jgi:hypothetical protein
MPNRTPVLVAVAALVTGLSAGLAFDSVYDISITARPSESFRPPTAPGSATTDSQQTAFSLRLVDTGGVGVPMAGDWGRDYSHDLRAFREAILEKPPYVDEAAFDRIERQWRAYVDRMVAYGNGRSLL